MTRCRNCDVPVLLLEFPSGERLWHHAPDIGFYDGAGVEEPELICDVGAAYFYCSRRRP